MGAGGADILINSLGGIAAGQTDNLLTFGSGSTYIGQGLDVKGVEFLGTGPTTATVTNISDPTYTLSLEGDGLKLDAGNAGVTLATKGIGLGTNQTWASNSSTSCAGIISGTGGLTKIGTGNGGTGVTLAGGTFALSNAVGQGTGPQVTGGAEKLRRLSAPLAFALLLFMMSAARARPRLGVSLRQTGRA